MLVKTKTYTGRIPSPSRAIPRGSVVIVSPYSSAILDTPSFPRYAESIVPVRPAPHINTSVVLNSCGGDMLLSVVNSGRLQENSFQSLDSRY